MKSNNKIYPWIVVALLWGVAFLNYMDRQMLSTMRDSMMIDISELESAANFGRLMAVFLWIYGIMSPISGVVGDRFSRKWLIIGSLFVWSFVTLLMGFCTSFTEIYILRGVMGVSEALYIPAGLSIIADYHTDKTRSLAVGLHMTGLYAGQAIGGFGAVVANLFSWQTTFHAFGFIGIAYSLILVLFLHDKIDKDCNTENVIHKESESPLNGMKLLLCSFTFWIILLYFAVPSIPGWATKNWLPTLFSSNLSIDMTKAGPISTITIAISSFLGVLIGGFFSDKWIQKNIRGRIYVSSIGTALTIPALFLLGLGNNFITTISGAIFYGVGFGMFDANNMPILCQFVSSKYRATAYGLMNTIGVFSGAFITTWLGKSTDSGHLGTDFALMSIIVIVVLTIELYFLRPRKDKLIGFSRE